MAVDSRLSSQLLYGEKVEKLDEDGDWMLVRNSVDDYVGYVHRSGVTDENASLQPTHYVTAKSTLLFATPDIKSPIVCRLPFASRLCASPASEPSFLQTVDQCYVWRQHCSAAFESVSTDIVKVSEQLFLGVPYLWGGRSADGFDCSGLVQMAAAAIGQALPRDSEQQELSIAERVETAKARRGDLVFWPGHVGMLAAADRLLHATAYSLDSRIEPLVDVVDRAGPISSIRRLPTAR